MILQYRLPFDIPELGARAGETVVIDTIDRTVEVARELPETALATVARLIPRLHPVHAPLPPEAAAALVAALAPPRSHLRLA